MSRISQDLKAQQLGSATPPISNDMSTLQLARKSIPHVAVIGAGFAGLRCADVLLQLGAKVTILEARNRVGGRVHQAINDGHMVDMGPNWIHGANGNPIMDIAERTKSTLVELGERHAIIERNGLRKSDQESTEIFGEVWATVLDAFKYSDSSHDSINVNTSLMDFFRAEVPKRFPGDRSKANEILKEATMWGFFVGDSIETQSLRCFFLEETLEGEGGFLASTYKPILAQVQQQALDGAEIKLNEEIVAIRYRSEQNSEDQVCLTNKRGQTSSFDEVVVSCPLGWLKRNPAAFEPPLPVHLTEAIDNIGYGRLEKLYVSFTSAFWYDENSETASSSASTRSTNLGSSKPTCPMSIHFQNPLYHPDPASKGSTTWNASVISMAHLPGVTSHPTLLFYLYGDCGQHLTSLTDMHEKNSPEYNRVLATFAVPFISKLPNYSPQDKRCEPTSCLLTSWQTDPFAGYGSYSNFQVGLRDGASDIETMRNAGGLSDQGKGLWIAGEHTAPFVALGTTTGAYWSGELVAQKIGRAYGLNDVSATDGARSDAMYDRETGPTM